MARIDCRNPECGFTRLSSCPAEDGFHISECTGCGDPEYIEPWNDLVETHEIVLRHQDPDDDTKFYECLCGELFLIFPEEQPVCPKDR